jgi:hypothetical protein
VSRFQGLDRSGKSARIDLTMPAGNPPPVMAPIGERFVRCQGMQSSDCM